MAPVTTSSPGRASLLRRALAASAALAVGAATLIGCTTAPSTDAETSASGTAASGTGASQVPDAGTWPRTIVHDAGETIIETKPEKIVSASVTLTGTLLALGAPVIGSGTTTPGPLADAAGFFSQWGPVAAERGVKPLYQLTIDPEAILAEAPDLIIGATNGQDAAKDAYAELSKIAPTIIVSYDDVSWQELAVTLGEAIGAEDAASDLIADYEDAVTAAKTAIKLPAQPTLPVIGKGAEELYALLPGSAQAQFLTELGFTLAVLPPEVAPAAPSEATARQDRVLIATEQWPASLAAAGSVAYFFDDGKKSQALAADPVFGATPPIAAGALFGLGLDSFRIDYYSSLNIIARLTQLFPG